MIAALTIIGIIVLVLLVVASIVWKLGDSPLGRMDVERL
jgi:hypothetical protein